MEPGPRDSGSTSWSPSASRPASRCSGICLGMQLLFESLGRERGRRRPRPAAAGSSPRSRPTATRSRTSAGRRSAGSTTRGSPRAWATETPFYFVHSFAPRPAADDDVLGTAAYGERFACAVERAAALRRPVPPGEVELGGARPAGQLRRASAVDPLPGDRHPRRQGRPPDPGRLRPRDRLRRRPGRRRPALGRRRRRVAARRRPRRRPGRRAGEPRARAADRLRGRTCRSSSAAACATRRRSRRPSPPAPSASSSGPPRVRDPEMAAAIASSARRAGGGLGRLPRRARSRSEGWTEASDLGAAEVIAALSERGACAASSTRRSRSTARWRGPTSTCSAGGRRRHRRRADLLGRDRLARRPSRALASWGSTNLGGVIVGRALYESRFTVAEAQSVLDR